MRIFVLDSDGLIKLVKSSIVEHLLRRFSCFISSEVYEEVVTKGEVRLYEDAFTVEALIEKNLLKVRRAEESERAKAVLRGKEELGLGEKTTLHLFFSLKADAAISDDKAFLKVLKENNIPFIIPSEVIPRFVKTKVISKEEGLRSLNMLKSYINKENYLADKRVIERGS